MMQAIISLHRVIDGIAAGADKGDNAEQEENEGGELDVLSEFEGGEARQVHVDERAEEEGQLGGGGAAGDQAEQQHCAAGEMGRDDVMGD